MKIIYVCKVVLKWVVANGNTVTASTFGSVTSIYANVKLDLLQINWGQWSLGVLQEVIKVGLVGAVGAFSGLLVKHLFEKYIIKKENK